MIGFGLAPRDFWALTPREWRWLAAGAASVGGEPLDRAGLNDLLNQFPDENT